MRHVVPLFYHHPLMSKNGWQKDQRQPDRLIVVNKPDWADIQLSSAQENVMRRTVAMPGQ